MNEVSVVKEGWLHKRGEGGEPGSQLSSGGIPPRLGPCGESGAAAATSKRELRFPVTRNFNLSPAQMQGDLRFPWPQNGAQGTLALQGIPKPADSFPLWFSLAPGSAWQLANSNATSLAFGLCRKQILQRHRFELLATLGS